MTIKSTVDQLEVAKFAQHASDWWDTEGPLKTLHDINPARIEFIQKFTPLSGLTILDVGCGGGILSERMAQLGGEVTGLDVESDALTTAKMHAEANNISVDYVCEPIEHFKAPSFDVITCMEMLEHVPEPECVIEHCARLLKPGGYLFLSTINRTAQAYASVVIAAEYILKLLPRQTHDYERFLKPSELASAVRSVGLETVGIAGISYQPFTRKASLQESVNVNYLLACRKP